MNGCKVVDEAYECLKFGLVFRCGEILKCFKLNRVEFHTYGWENYTIKANFRLSDFTFVVIED